MGRRDCRDPWVTSSATHTTSKLRPVLGAASSGREVPPVPWAGGLAQWAGSHLLERRGHSRGSRLQGAVSTWPSRLQQAGLPGRLVRCPGSSACWVLLELAGAKLHRASHMPAGCQGSEKVGGHGGTVKGKHLLAPGALRRPLSQAQHRASWPGRAVPGPQVGSRQDLGRRIFLSAYSIHFG